MVHQYIEFAAANWPLVVALVIIIALIAADELNRHSRSLKELDATNAVHFMNRGATVIDCRDEQAFKKGHLSNSRHIPLDRLSGEADSLKPKRSRKARPVIVIGPSSRSSHRAVTILNRAGIQQVYTIRGGIQAWTKENLPIETSS